MARQTAANHRWIPRCDIQYIIQQSCFLGGNSSRENEGTFAVKLATMQVEDGGTAAVVITGERIVRVDALEDPVPGTVLDVIEALTGIELEQRVDATAADRFEPTLRQRFRAPYVRPHKIWGIGLNYREHADDLEAAYPDEPASFIKGDHTIIGQGEPIPLPAQSRRVTAEAELGLVIGRYCRDVAPDAALDYVWGVCPVLDQTAEDILQRNPRFLTRAKNFPGFFSFGPGIVPMHHVGELADVRVSTVRNGQVERSNLVSNMIFDPAFLVSFHSRVMPLFPGDVISTGTPGAVVINGGDVIECRIDGIGMLENPVVPGPATIPIR